jgi:LCP family protein required for cell wall assembly
MAEGTRRLQSRGPHARRLADPSIERPSQSNTRSNDLRRSVAAVLSAVFPGAGQAFNRRWRLALLFAVPVAILLLATAIAAGRGSRAGILATLIEPEWLQALLILDVALLVWRGASVVQAFLDRRHVESPGRISIVALAAFLLFTAAPHVVAATWIQTAQTSFARVFKVTDANATLPALTGRLNVLIIGVDQIPGRTENLTDTMMVASLDPIGRMVSLVSVPRDMVNVPLPDGSTFAPKLNSLMSYADRHPQQFPQGGIAVLERTIGSLLGIEISYYARMDFIGFVKLVDSVGGVYVNVDHGFQDPRYDGYGLPYRGFNISAGLHHLDGPQALAYARSRQGVGESDFKRAARQQQILVALRNRLMEGGALFWRVPSLLSTLGDFLTTDVPVRLLPRLAEIADSMKSTSVRRLVIGAPLVKAGRSQYGSVLFPNLDLIRAAAARMFPPPGTAPLAPPHPSATTRPAASGSSAAP